jgi:hypothetical protein
MNADESDDFSSLVATRKQLQEFCASHVPSLLSFSFPDDISFKLDKAEPVDSEKTGVRHLTSSATCIESLLTCPQHYYTGRTNKNDVEAIPSRAAEFAEAALDRDDWTSDNSGPIYCRSRALPVVIRHLRQLAGARAKAIEGHLLTVFEQVSNPSPAQPSKLPPRFGIGEWYKEAPADSYPPNAYHSYWALEALTAAREREINPIERKWEDAILLWAKMKLGTEVAMHAAKSTLLDSDQLSWAITIHLAFQDSLAANLADQDLVRHALKELFSTQTDSGTWRHYRPLFHYEKAGNAYCYNFETFATMLNVALKRYEHSPFYLNIFRDHFANLKKLFEYADRTRQPARPNSYFEWNVSVRANHLFQESIW